MTRSKHGTRRFVVPWFIVTAALFALVGCGTHPAAASSTSVAATATAAPHAATLDVFGHCSGWVRTADLLFVGHGGVPCGKR